MKKKTLVLLVTVILAAAVCAGLALLLRQEPESPASQKTAAQTLLNRSEAEVRSVTVTSAGRQIAASRDQNGTLVIPALDGLPVDQEKIDALAKYSALLRSQQTLTDAQRDLEEYGLDEQTATHVQAEFDDGQTMELWVGEAVPGASTPSNYVLYEQNVHVMFQLHVSPFLKQEEDFIRTAITPSNDDSSYVNLGIIVPHIQAYFFSRLTALYCLDTVSHFLADSVYGFIADI